MENVEESKERRPLIETDKGLMPCPDSRGQTFQKWCKAMKRAGYKLQHRELQACDYGAPTIRKRLFVTARRDELPIVWPEPTHGAPTDRDVMEGRKLPWRTAAEIIDWSLPCPSIFATVEEIRVSHRVKAVRPLADNTMARMARGMKRYVLDAERPFIVNLTHGARCESVDTPFNTITGAHRGEKALVSPHLASYYSHTGSRSERTSEIDDLLATVTCENRHTVIAPSVIRFNTGATGQDACEPLPTVTANGYIKRPGGAAPALTAAQQGGSVRGVEQPHHTITASSKDQNSVIVPTLIGCGGGAEQSRPRGGGEPMATITAKADVCVATAFVAQHNNDSRRVGGVNPGRAADEPLSTVTATGAQQGVVAAHITKMYGKSDAQSLAEPHHTIGANAKSALVAPYLQAYYGTGDGGEEDQPCRTITTKDRHGHVEVSLGASPFTEAQAARAREVAHFLRAHGFWDEREFVTIVIGGETFVVVDIGMRMLTPRELYSAQGFPADYKIDVDGDGGPFPKSVQVSCVGNLVSPPVAVAIVAANCQHLAEYREAAE